MVSVVKIGGSLLSYPKDLQALCQRLGELSGEHDLLIVPGGGPFADAVRKVYSEMELPEATAHRMAVLAIDQYGILLQSILGDSAQTIEYFSEADACFEDGQAAVLLASQMMRADRSLPKSWDVTSDSIAAYVAGKVDAEMLVLVKSVDGLFKQGSKRLLNRVPVSALASGVEPGCVDAYLPKILASSSRFRCFIVNGRYPDRVAAVLQRKGMREVVGTEVVRR
ncbi:MAG: uridylate kinase [Thaumarchaeota archaeon]|nr:uridylate kinase [Nitrososphaerota archaeon]